MKIDKNLGKVVSDEELAQTLGTESKEQVVITIDSIENDDWIRSLPGYDDAKLADAVRRKLDESSKGNSKD